VGLSFPRIRRKESNVKAPSRKAGLFCLLVFILAVVGHFVPLSGVPVAGPALVFLNQYSYYVMMFGYGLLLLAVYVL
jgi:hypothetical protein